MGYLHILKIPLHKIQGKEELYSKKSGKRNLTQMMKVNITNKGAYGTHAPGHRM